MSRSLANKIKLLWDDPSIQNIWKLRDSYYSLSNASYFFDHRLDDISSDTYIPSWEDYLKIRMRSNGIYTEAGIVNTHKLYTKYVFMDTPGTRSARKNWLLMLTDSFNTIIYHFPIGDYNSVCYEDSTTDRAKEAFDLFSTLIDRGFFTNKQLIILFTKYDIFLEKIQRVPITAVFPDFPDDILNPNNAVDVAEFVYKKLKQCLDEKNVELIAPVKLYCIDTTDTTQSFYDFLTDMNNEIFDGFLRNQLKGAQLYEGGIYVDWFSRC